MYKGEVLEVELNAKGHPFWIKTKKGTGQDNAVSSGISGVGQGKTSGVLIWDTNQIEDGAVYPGSTTYYYQCEYHAAMVGKITVRATKGTTVF